MSRKQHGKARIPAGSASMMDRTSTAMARWTLIGAAVTRGDVLRPMSLLLLLLALSSLASPVSNVCERRARDDGPSRAYMRRILFATLVLHARRACVTSTLGLSFLARSGARSYAHTYTHTQFRDVYTRSVTHICRTCRTLSTPQRGKDRRRLRVA